MTWRKDKPDDPTETVFQSEALEYPEIAQDLHAVIARLAQHQAEEHAPSGNRIWLHIDATNGHILITWYDVETQESIGPWAFYLELRKLWDLSLTHPDGAFHFDQQAHIAICCVTEDFILEEEDPVTGTWTQYDRFQLYEQFEGSKEPKQVII